MKAGKYYLSILLSVLTFAAPAACLVWLLLRYSTVGLIFTGVSVLFAVAAYKPLERMRIEYRKDVEYDEFGLSKSKGRYERLSKAERDAIDLQKTAHAEVVLDSTALRKMTREGSVDPAADLDRLVGLPNVKQKVKSLAARMQFEAEERKDKKKQKELKKTGASSESLSGRHMVFFGPPGTGKTTVARIMTGYLYKYGFIKQNKCVEIDGNFLKAGSDTALKTTLVIRQAYGGVLFIDEAYALMQGSNGDEAIASIIKQMEDEKTRFVLILAGYTDEMKRLINANPGFESRVKEYLYFSDYSDGELFEIFTKMANSRGFTVDSSAMDPFFVRISKEKQFKSFGNARTVRNIAEEAIDRHALQFSEGKLDPVNKYRIMGSDVSTVVSGISG